MKKETNKQPKAMKKTITVEFAIAAFNNLRTAKVGKMKDSEKFTVAKALRSLRPIAKSFNDLTEDIREKFKPENFDDLVKKTGEEGRGSAEQDEALRELNRYNKSVNDCINQEIEKEVEIDIEPLSEEALGRLVASNDFNLETIMALRDVLC